jgi:hypothetical protein
MDKYPPGRAARWCGFQRNRERSYFNAHLPDGEPYRKCDESPSDVIRRLSGEFYPLNVAALAAPYLTSDEPFDAKAFVLLVTRAWQEIRRAIKAKEREIVSRTFHDRSML